MRHLETNSGSAKMQPMEIDRYDDRAEAFRELEEWAKLGLKLERAEGSAAHRLRTAWAQDNVLWLQAPAAIDAKMPAPSEHVNFFVVQHDWAAAFKGAQDFEGGDFQLPYESVAFEFRISGKRVVALVEPAQKMGDAVVDKTITVLVECRDVWVMPILTFVLLDGEWEPMDREEEGNPFADLPAFLVSQIKAACVSLEAEVAVADRVEVPDKLNAARIRRGHEPLPEYNIVRLNRYPRTAHLAGDGAHTKKRLHFRRGHWRHLAEEKRTWVRWCLVGDPDLGFIDKEYRL